MSRSLVLDSKPHPAETVPCEREQHSGGAPRPAPGRWFAEVPCRSHPCDNCRRCKQGQCCRRDDPAYTLPKLGEWEGPIFGDLGVITNDGERALCHICGRWYHNLAAHAAYKHDVIPDEYRAIFGLNATTGLVGPVLEEKLRRRAKELLAEIGPATLEGLRREGKLPKGFLKGRMIRLQQRLEQSAPERLAEVGPKISAGLRQAYAAGERVPLNRFTPNITRQGQARVQELMADPVWKAQWLEKMAAAQRKRRRREQVTCAVCGTTFEATPSARRVICSDPACKMERRRQIGRVLKVIQRPEIRAKSVATNRARLKQHPRDVQGRFIGRLAAELT